MNKLVGRKIYIHWGDRVLAIEQLLVDPDKFGFDLPKRRNNRCYPASIDRGGVLIANIYECMGEKIEGKKQISHSHPALSSEISNFLIHRECWYTDEEMKKIIEMENEKYSTEHEFD